MEGSVLDTPSIYMYKNKLLTIAAKFCIIAYIISTMVTKSAGNIAVRLARLAVFGVVVFYFITEKKVMTHRSFYLFRTLVFIGLCAVVSLLMPFEPIEAATYFKATLNVYIVTVLIFEFLLFNPDFFDGILMSILAGSFLKCMYVFCCYGWLCFLNSRKIEGISANTIGYYGAWSALIALYFCIKHGKNYRVVWMLAAMVNVIFTLLSASRKSLLFLGIPVMVYLIAYSRNPKIVIRNLAVVIGGALGVWIAITKIPVLYNLLGHRFVEMLAGFSGGADVDGSTKTRMKLISYGMQWYKERPFWGHGLNNFKMIMAQRCPKEIALYAHNNYVELLVDTGIIGTVVYYSLYLVNLLKGFRVCKSKKLEDIVCLGIMISLFVTDYGQVSYSVAITQIMLAMISARFIHADIFKENISK